MVRYMSTANTTFLEDLNEFCMYLYAMVSYYNWQLKNSAFPTRLQEVLISFIFLIFNVEKYILCFFFRKRYTAEPIDTIQHTSSDIPKNEKSRSRQNQQNDKMLPVRLCYIFLSSTHCPDQEKLHHFKSR